MIKGEQLYEGKAKKVFKTDDPGLLIVSYKDDATAFNGQKGCHQQSDEQRPDEASGESRHSDPFR